MKERFVPPEAFISGQAPPSSEGRQETAPEIARRAEEEGGSTEKGAHKYPEDKGRLPSLGDKEWTPEDQEMYQDVLKAARAQEKLAEAHKRFEVVHELRNMGVYRSSSELAKVHLKDVEKGLVKDTFYTE